MRKKLSSLVCAVFLAVVPSCAEYGVMGGTEGGYDFEGVVVTFFGGGPLADVPCRLLYNDTAAPIPGFSFVSGRNGSFSLEGVPEQRVGVECHAVDELTVQTHQFNLAAPATGATVHVVVEDIYWLGMVQIDVSRDDAKGLVAGTVLWRNPAGGQESIGCAEVESSAGGEIRYFNSSGLPLGGRYDTHPHFGKYLIVNLQPGPVTLGFSVKGDRLGSLDTHTFAGPATVTIADIYARGSVTEDPTPVTCGLY